MLWVLFFIVILDNAYIPLERFTLEKDCYARLTEIEDVLELKDTDRLKLKCEYRARRV